MKNLRVLLLVTMLVTVMLMALGGSLAFADSGSGDPQIGKPVGWASYTFYNAQLTSNATQYSASPLTRSGLDLSKVVQWGVAEVFVTADVSGTATVTVTPQLSNDATNWVSAYWNTISGTTVTAQPYRIVLSADGGNYLRLPVAGEYLRFKIESSATSSQTVTTTVRATLKNYQ